MPPVPFTTGLPEESKGGLSFESLLTATTYQGVWVRSSMKTKPAAIPGRWFPIIATLLDFLK
jgi:hypothetical protein